MKYLVKPCVVKILLAMLSIGVVSSIAFAGDRIGNGGDVLKTSTGLRVLDLVESGVADGPYIDFENPNADLAAEVKDLFARNPNVTANDVKVLTAYLSEMPMGQAYALLVGMRAYSWNWVNETFVGVPDVDSPVNYKPEDIVQAAIRSGFSIAIQQQVWDQLDSRNRAALLLHEIIYAYEIPQQKVDVVSGRTYLDQSSPVARGVVGDLFSKGYIDFNHYSLDGKSLFGSVLPHENDGMTETVVPGVSFNADGSPMFQFGPTVQYGNKFEYMIPGHFLGSTLSSFSKDMDWVNGNFDTDFSEELLDECDDKKRVTIESNGEAGTLVISASSTDYPFHKQKGLADIQLTGASNTFTVHFSGYAGLTGPMVFLKPVITTQTYTNSKTIPSTVPQAQCVIQLKKQLIDTARSLLRL